MKNLYKMLIISVILSACDTPQRNRFIETPAFNPVVFNTGDSSKEINEVNSQSETQLNNNGSTTLDNNGSNTVNDSNTGQTQQLYNCSSSSGLCINALGSFEYYVPRVNSYTFKMHNNPLAISGTQGVCFAPFLLNPMYGTQTVVGNIECNTYNANASYSGTYSIYPGGGVNGVAVFHAALVPAFNRGLQMNSSQYWRNFEMQYQQYFRLYTY